MFLSGKNPAVFLVAFLALSSSATDIAARVRQHHQQQKQTHHKPQVSEDNDDVVRLILIALTVSYSWFHMFHPNYFLCSRT